MEKGLSRLLKRICGPFDTLTHETINEGMNGCIYLWEEGDTTFQEMLEKGDVNLEKGDVNGRESTFYPLMIVNCSRTDGEENYRLMPITKLQIDAKIEFMLGEETNMDSKEKEIIEQKARRYRVTSTMLPFVLKKMIEEGEYRRVNQNDKSNTTGFYLTRRL